MRETRHQVNFNVPSWLWWALKAAAFEANEGVGPYAYLLLEEALTARAAGRDLPELECPQHIEPRIAANIILAAGAEGVTAEQFVSQLIEMGWLAYHDNLREEQAA